MNRVLLSGAALEPPIDATPPELTASAARGQTIFKEPVFVAQLSTLSARAPIFHNERRTGRDRTVRFGYVLQNLVVGGPSLRRDHTPHITTLVVEKSHPGIFGKHAESPFHQIGTVTLDEIEVPTNSVPTIGEAISA